MLEFTNDSMIDKFLIILKIFEQLFCDGICLFSSDSISFDGFVVIVDLTNDLENFVGAFCWSGSFDRRDDEFLTIEEAVGFFWFEICLVVDCLDWIFIRKISDLLKRVQFDSLIVLRRGEESGTKSFWWVIRKVIYRILFSCFIDLINSCPFGNCEFPC